MNGRARFVRNKRTRRVMELVNESRRGVTLKDANGKKVVSWPDYRRYWDRIQQPGESKSKPSTD